MFGMYQILLKTKKRTWKLQRGKETDKFLQRKKGEIQNWVILKKIRDKLKIYSIIILS